MFGCCALIRKSAIFFLLIGLLPVADFAQARPSSVKAPGKSRSPAAAKEGTGPKGIVVAEEEATVFNAPDFDAQVIATLPPGAVYDISSGKKGPFYKIRVKPGLVGWVSDADVRPLATSAVNRIEEMKKAATGKATAPGAGAKDSALGESPSDKTKGGARKPLHRNRYGGLGLESVNYVEDTMGKSRRENLLFYGARFTGPNVIVSGDMLTDAEILFHSGAPKYYESATGNPAGGFILLGNFLFINEVPQTPTVMAYYGFGPTFRWSHFEVTLDQTTMKRSYALDDMTLGAVFNAGVAFGVGRYAVRLDGRYYWETQKYTSFALAFQREF
ncbi:MAG: SH3 domain-containing protein [Bdellovibrionaceae bacterium]|nr:SH3 domain-containing protein [Pseudobdellovibrionaceae bacterium]MBX3033451.1 SH3 domain-containing protein [Pseudobdellovibrionaceae bacterium]